MEDNLKKLKKYGRFLNEEAKKDHLDPIIGREQEIRRVIEILSRKKKNNPVLVGCAGVGKTAIVEGLTQRIYSKDVPDNLLNKKIFELNFASLLSGTKFQGEFEQRLKMITDVIKENNDILLFIDELHLIVGAGRTQGAIDASNILKPMLAKGELRCIGATTSNEYRQYIEKDTALERRFQKIYVQESTIKETITILRGIKIRFESFHGVTIKDNALISAAKLSNRYLTLRKLPDKAIDLIDEACAKIKTEISSVPNELDNINRKIIQLTIEENALKKEEEKDFNINQRLKVIESKLKEKKEAQATLQRKWVKEKKIYNQINDCNNELINFQKTLKTIMQQGNYDKAGEIKYRIIPSLKNKLKMLKESDKKNNLLKNYVDHNDIAEVVSFITKIPLQKLLKNEKEKYLDLFQKLRSSVIGQEHALESVHNAILKSRAGLNDPSKPIASFLFVGPTGVGKTLVAKKLAENIFDDQKKLIQIDMSEYNTKHSISRLIGSPPGYVGYEQGGQLTEKVKNNPYSVILFDEFEKANQEVQNLLLQLLEEGVLTDGTGKVINFQNTIIIMTSNIGSDVPKNVKNTQNFVLQKVKQKLSNELFNRIDEVIVFNTLNKINIMEIVNLELNNFLQRIQEQKNIIFQYNNEVINKILDDNDFLNYGARPIKRYIIKNISPLIAEGIIKEEFIVNETYMLTFAKNMFKIKKGVLN